MAQNPLKIFIFLSNLDYSNRVVALNPGSIEMLKNLEIWPTIQQNRLNELKILCIIAKIHQD